MTNNLANTILLNSIAIKLNKEFGEEEKAMARMTRQEIEKESEPEDEEDDEDYQPDYDVDPKCRGYEK